MRFEMFEAEVIANGVWKEMLYFHILTLSTSAKDTDCCSRVCQHIILEDAVIIMVNLIHYCCRTVGFQEDFNGSKAIFIDPGRCLTTIHDDIVSEAFLSAF